MAIPHPIFTVAQPQNTVAFTDYPYEMDAYMGMSREGGKALYYFDLGKNTQTDGPIDEQLSAQKVNVIYLNFQEMQGMNGPQLTERLKARGWEPIGFENSPKNQWVLLSKAAAGR